MGKKTFSGKFMGRGCSTWGTNDQIMPGGEGSLINAFSSKLNTVSLKIFTNHVGIYTIVEGLILDVNS